MNIKFYPCFWAFSHKSTLCPLFFHTCPPCVHPLLSLVEAFPIHLAAINKSNAYNMKISNAKIDQLLPLCITYGKLFITFFLMGFLISSAQAQTEVTPVGIAAGVSYGYAPSLQYESTESSGSFYSVYGDLVINDKIVGRAQFSKLLVNTLSNELSRFVSSGFAFNGSLGYNFIPSADKKFQIPVMGTIGYASIERSTGSSRPGMQIGVTLAPKYQVTDQVIVNTTLRMLRGTNFDDGAKLSQNDISIGVMYSFQ